MSQRIIHSDNKSISIYDNFLSFCDNFYHFWNDFEKDEKIKFLIIKNLHYLSHFFYFGAIHFRFFVDMVLCFIIMLFYISNILFIVSIYNNIYNNIIYFSREVKGNYEGL